MVTPRAPPNCDSCNVPAKADGPNKVKTPIAPKASAPIWRFVNPYCPKATANPSNAIGVRAELITAARPAVIYFRP